MYFTIKPNLIISSSIAEDSIKSSIYFLKSLLLTNLLPIKTLLTFSVPFNLKFLKSEDRIHLHEAEIDLTDILCNAAINAGMDIKNSDMKETFFNPCHPNVVFVYDLYKDFKNHYA
jgi:hypothetical protein